MQKQVIKSVLTLFACWQWSVAVEPMVLITIVNTTLGCITFNHLNQVLESCEKVQICNVPVSGRIIFESS